MRARPFDLTVPVCLFLGVAAWADEWEHLGNPPEGFAHFEARSLSQVTPVQFAGTVEPPEIYMNGKRLDLQSRAEVEKAGQPGFWVNQDSVEVAGEAGRFFKELSADEAAVESVDIKIRSGSGRVFQASVALGRTFLDDAFSKKIELPDSAVSADLPFTFSGRIPPKTRLEVETGRVETDGDGKTRLEIPLRLGRSVLIARLLQADSSERLINVPIEVMKISHSPGRPILALRVPEEARSGESWALPARELEISGRTSPGATLTMDGQKIPVNREGEFDTHFTPRLVEQNIDFEIQLGSGATASYSKPVRCLECSGRMDTAPPPSRKFYVFGSAVGLIHYADGEASQVFSGAPITLGLGTFAQEDLALEASASSLPGIAGIWKNQGKTYGVSSANMASVVLSHSLIRSISVGLGGSYEKVLLTGVSADPSGITLRWHLGFRAGITRNLDYIARLQGTIIRFGNEGMHIVGVFELLGLRYYLF